MNNERINVNIIKKPTLSSSISIKTDLDPTGFVGLSSSTAKTAVDNINRTISVDVDTSVIATKTFVKANFCSTAAASELEKALASKYQTAIKDLQNKLAIQIAALTSTVQNEVFTLDTKLTEQLNTKLAQHSDPNSIYVVDSDGNQIMESYGDEPEFKAVRRTVHGTIKANTPTAVDDVTTKQYVDSEVESLSGRIKYNYEHAKLLNNLIISTENSLTNKINSDINQATDEIDTKYTNLVEQLQRQITILQEDIKHLQESGGVDSDVNTNHSPNGDLILDSDSKEQFAVESNGNVKVINRSLMVATDNDGNIVLK